MVISNMWEYELAEDLMTLVLGNSGRFKNLRYDRNNSSIQRMIYFTQIC